MKSRTLILLSLAILLGAACSPMEKPETGTVTLAFRVGEPATRAGDGNVTDGSGIYCTKVAGPPVVYTPDLHIFICDRETGEVVKHFPEVGNVEECDWVSGDKATYLAVAFSFSGEGTYSVYALANVGTTGSNLEIPSLAGVTNASQLDAMILTLTDSALATDPNTAPDLGDRMPLSAKGTLNVQRGLSAGNYIGHVELQMLRCVNQVQLSFKNLTGEELNLYNCVVTFKQLNAKQGWLFPADPDFVELGDGADSDKFDDNYRDYVSTAKDLTGIPASSEVPLFTTPIRFFPSEAPMQTTPSKGKRYLCDITFRIVRSGKTYDPSKSSTYDVKNFTNLPIHDPNSQDILSLGRNQYLQIVTTVSKGNDVSFNFRVKEWTEHHATVEFN